MPVKILNDTSFLIGKKFGKLEVISFSKYKKFSIAKTKYFGKQRWWNCKCDCGGFKEILEQSLKRKQTQSCGCLHKVFLKSGATSRRLLKGQAFNCLYSRYMGSAKHRKLIFNLTKEEFRNFTIQNCYYCNIPPSTFYKKWINKLTGDFDTYIYNGVDRINNKIGYIITNCVSCCSICNMMKLENSKKDFLSKIKLIYENLKSNDVNKQH